MTGAAIRDQRAEIREISLEQLEAARLNPRRTIDETELAELAASIREHGVAVPLLVRPLEMAGDGDLVSTDVTAQGKMAQTADPAKVLKDGQWVAAKKGSCPNVRPGVTVDWSDDGNRGYMGRSEKLCKPGETLLVCIACGCKVHKKEYEKPKSENTANPRFDAAAEKLKGEKRKAAAIEESKLRMAVASKAVEAVTKLPAEAVRDMAIHASPNGAEDLRIARAILPGLDKTLKTAKVDSVEFAKAVALASLEELAANEYGGSEQGREKFLASVKRLGWTGPNPWKAAKKPEVKAAPKRPAKKATKKAGKR